MALYILGAYCDNGGAFGLSPRDDGEPSPVIPETLYLLEFALEDGSMERRLPDSLTCMCIAGSELREMDGGVSEPLDGVVF